MFYFRRYAKDAFMGMVQITHGTHAVDQHRLSFGGSVGRVLYPLSGQIPLKDF